ncbi:MAG: hypothetical protein EOO59_03455 [Hymenobacter sp.]|nr:MAG: hypothetical protein EOO59_03455 [Hymenobacter sp.]
MFASYSAAAQIVGADSAAVAASAKLLRQAYVAGLQTESVLYDGPEYVDYTTPGTRGHQFFLGPEVQMGTVSYRGGYFNEVPLRYDLLRDQPVLLFPGQAVAVALVPGKLPAFSLGSHRFVRIEGDTLAANALPAGYYELLVEGPVRLLARYTKRVRQNLIGGALMLEYQQSTLLFARTATAVTELSSLKKLMALLPEAQRPELQRYARQQHLKFGAEQRAEAAERLLRYYYTLRP